MIGGSGQLHVESSPAARVHKLLPVRMRFRAWASKTSPTIFHDPVLSPVVKRRRRRDAMDHFQQDHEKPLFSSSAGT
jgi:hypothetical protein